MKMLKKFMAIMLTLLMILSVVPAFAETIPSTDGITLSRTSSYITVGMTVQLTADASVTWSTSNGAVATVSETGLVTAVAAGNADITATTADGKTAVCKVYVSELEIRNHTTTPTPALDGGEFLTDLFDKEKFKVMLTFDETAEDITGNINTTVIDNLTYESGFNGKAANFTNGYVELTDAVLGNGSITISTWVKPGTLLSATPDYIFATTPINPGSNINDGFYLGMKSANLDFFCIRKPWTENASGYRRSISTPITSDVTNGWVNLTWVIDKTKNKYSLYVDYEPIVTNTSTNAAIQWDGEWAPRIGAGVDRYGDDSFFDGLIDDFFIYDGVMSYEDLQRIKSYYKLTEVVPTEGVSINEDRISLNINETSTLIATVAPTNATMKDIVWTTSDSSVVTVDKGRVRATGAGNAVITAKTVDGGFVARTSVNVSDVTEPFRYDRVCILGVDGAGEWLDDEFMPNVREIFSSYATTQTARTGLPSVSAPGWGAILHGVAPEVHKVTNYTGAKQEFPGDSPYPSIFRILHEAEPDAKMASFGSFSAINVGIIENNIGVHKGYGTDEVCHTNALKYLEENDPKLFFMYYEASDSTGHQYGYGPEFPEYVAAMGKIDGYIGEIYDAYEEKGLLDSTLFIICTDHGGTINGTHGGDSDREMNTFLGLSGPGVKMNSTIGESNHRDVAAIAAHALGLERPATWTAKVPDGAFDSVFGDTRNEFEYPGSNYREHINVRTPVKEGEHLTDIFEEDKFEFLLEFDGEAKDVMGNHEITVNKNITYEEGYFGQSANFSQGSVTLDQVDIESSDLTIGAWVKTDGFPKKSVFMCSKPRMTTAGDGFYFVMEKDFSTFAIKSHNETQSRTLSEGYYPADMNDGWTHIMMVIDSTNNKIEYYTDFILNNGGSYNVDCTISGNPITIGSTTDASYSYPLTASLDDVFIYKGAMTAEDIAKLQTYYEREGTALHVNDVEFGDAVSFDFVVDGDITDSYLYAAIYNENMKLINVKKIPARSAGGESVSGGANAKYFKAFLIDSTLLPKSVPATATKN